MARKKTRKLLLLEAVSTAGRGSGWEKYGQELAEMGRALRKYVDRRRLRVSVEWPAVGSVVVVVVIALSVTRGYFESPTLGGNRQEVIVAATEAGDYETAQRLYEEMKVLGEQVGGQSLEELVYPRRKLKREIAENEELLRQYPEHLDLLLRLVEQHLYLGEKEKAAWYLERASYLEPNGERVKEMRERLE